MAFMGGERNMCSGNNYVPHRAGFMALAAGSMLAGWEFWLLLPCCEE